MIQTSKPIRKCDKTALILSNTHKGSPISPISISNETERKVE